VYHVTTPNVMQCRGIWLGHDNDLALAKQAPPIGIDRDWPDFASLRTYETSRRVFFLL